MRKIKFLKTYLLFLVKYFTILFIISLGNRFIHELGHAFASFLVGVRVSEIQWLSGAIIIRDTQNISLFNMIMVYLMGSIFAMIFLLLLLPISLGKKNLVLCTSSAINMGMELFYWIISPIIKKGDGFDICDLLDIEISTYYIYIFSITSILIIFFSYFLIKYIKILIEGTIAFNKLLKQKEMELIEALPLYQERIERKLKYN